MNVLLLWLSNLRVVASDMMHERYLFILFISQVYIRIVSSNCKDSLGNYIPKLMLQFKIVDWISDRSYYLEDNSLMMNEHNLRMCSLSYNLLVFPRPPSWHHISRSVPLLEWCQRFVASGKESSLIRSVVIW